MDPGIKSITEPQMAASYACDCSDITITVIIIIVTKLELESLFETLHSLLNNYWCKIVANYFWSEVLRTVVLKVPSDWLILVDHLLL